MADTKLQIRIYVCVCDIIHKFCLVCARINFGISPNVNKNLVASTQSDNIFSRRSRPLFCFSFSLHSLSWTTIRLTRQKAAVFHNTTINIETCVSSPASFNQSGSCILVPMTTLIYATYLGIKRLHKPLRPA